MKKIPILGVMVGLLFAGVSSFAQVVVPALSAKISLAGSTYTQEVKVQFPASVSLEEIRASVLDGQFMNDVNDWVTKASYTPENKTSYNFWLSIGKLGVEYTHKFLCQERGDSAFWEQYCNEDAQEPKGTRVVVNGRSSVSCTKNVAGDNTTQCVFKMAGHTNDIKKMLIKVDAPYVAYKLFVENTSYIAHLSLLLVNDAKSSEEVRQMFLKTNYAAIISDLNAQIDVAANNSAQIPFSYTAQNFKASADKNQRLASRN